MTFFLIKDKEGNIQMVHWVIGAMPWMQECLKNYKEWLKEAKTRKHFSTITEENAAKGGVNGFIWYLDLTENSVETYQHDYLEELDFDTGKRKTITTNPSIA